MNENVQDPPENDTSDSSFLASSLALSIEKAINTALKFDPATRRNLADFNDKVIGIVCTSPSLTLGLHFNDCFVNVQVYQNLQSHKQNFDATLTGTLNAFVTLAKNKSNHSLADSDLNVSGNMAFLSKVQALANNIEIDWEDAISQATHPVFGHAAASAIRSIHGHFQQQKAFVEENLASLMADELELIALRPECEYFFDQVDLVKEQADRLEAKIDAYINRHTS